MEYGYSKLSIGYHNIFNYPLTKFDLDKWYTKLKNSKTQKFKIVQTNNFHFINGRQNIITKRLENERYSKEKFKIAKNAAKLISKIPTVKFVGVTGALAMNNAGRNSDIDLMVINSQNMLWTTRLLVYFLLIPSPYSPRRPRIRSERDRLCLNMWLDENDLVWDKKDRNIYTAHEIAQIVPLVNKNKTYEKFLYLNRWILDFWPNAVEAKYIERSISYIGKTKTQYTIYNILYTFVEKLAFKLQYLYMKSKITREVISKTRAIFHPNDWGKVVFQKLKS